MKKFIVRLIRSPRSLLIRFFDRFIVPTWMRLLGVRIGSGCRFNGLPVLRIESGSKVILGEKVLINSRFDSNSAGISHPTILSTQSPDSIIRIGDGTGISGASIVARAGIEIGKRVLVGAGVCIWDTDFHPLDPDLRRESQTRDALFAPIKIEDDVFIGGRSIILKGVHIGPKAIIGAGTVVSRDVEPGTVVIGNPARVITAFKSKLSKNE